MKLIYSFATALLLVFHLSAQAPANDAFNCATMVNLGVAPNCSGDLYTNVNATPSLIAPLDTVSCFNSGTAKRDVWFKFTCADTLFDYRISLLAGGTTPIKNPEFAVYRGDCMFNGLAEIACASAGAGVDSIGVDLFDLFPNEVYYIRVSDWSPTAAPNSGQFSLCIAPIPTVLTINDGGSSLCRGTLYDSGGPDSDYDHNENATFVICPNQPSECISFTLEYYHLEPSPPQVFPQGLGDQLFFYDGPNANSPLLAALDGTGFNENDIAGGGGVCFQVRATSGCLTVRFKSDASVQEEGWKGSWTCSSDPCPVEAIMQIDTSVTASDIEGAVSTGGAMVTLSSIDCPSGAMGTFQFPAGDNALNMEKGLLLTTGQALDARGPNNDEGTSTENPPLFFDDFGDPDLDYLSEQFGSGSASADVCIVELDVFAATNEVVFEYVFGSEEYPEYVGDPSGFNDIFAFLVSGPGIVGDPNLTNDALNIALLPNGSTLVQIDSVNQISHWQYYRNNELGAGLEYDGLSSDYLGVKKSLTARVPVIPCNTYHLKLAIADRGDESWDSGVFISEIKAGSPDLAVQFFNPVDYFVEDCTGDNDTLFISLSKPATQPTTFNLKIGGTATRDFDYLLQVPDSITFQTGQQVFAFPIIPIADGQVEGPEFLTITLSHDYGCGEVDLKTLKIQILDNVAVEVEGGDTLHVCRGDYLQLNATGAGHYVWEPQNLVSNPFIGNPFMAPEQSVWLEVFGSIGSCFDRDSVFVLLNGPTIEVLNPDQIIICEGSSVQLEAVSSEPQVAWSPATGLSDPNSLTPIASPTTSTLYRVTSSADGCTATDSVFILVDQLFKPTVIQDVTICQHLSVQLANILENNNTYSWEPQAGLSDPDISGPIATPDTTTLYILTVTSEHGACIWKDSVLVTVTPANIDILGPDSLRICLGSDPIVLETAATPPSSTVFWSPDDYLSSNSGFSVTVNPLETVTITAKYEVNGCPPVYDSVYIRVDSLPNMAIYAEPDKAFYCPGDTVYLLSPLFVKGNIEKGGFPDISHNWEPFGNQLTDLDKYVLIFIATDSNMYRRITVNGACSTVDSIFIPVPEPPDLPFEVIPDTICAGQQAQIFVFPDPANTHLEWDPMTASTLDCDKCNHPIATPTVTTVYHVTTPDAECPSGADVQVTVLPSPTLNIADNPISCSGAEVQLGFMDEPDVIYQWEPTTFLDDPSSGKAKATPTAPGDYEYTVTATNSIGCSRTATVTLHAYIATVEIVAPTHDLCAGATLTLAANTSGSQGVLSWLPEGPVVSPSDTTEYTVTLTFGGICSVSDKDTINVIPLPVLDLAQNAVSCVGAAVELNHTNDPDHVTYQWSPSNGLNNSTIGNPGASPLTSTTYTVIATTLVGGCTATGSVFVEVAAAIVSIDPSNVRLCFGEPVTLTATADGFDGGTYSWSNLLNGPTIEITPTITQTLTVTYTYGPNLACTATATAGVTVGPALLLSDITGPIDSVCNGGGAGLKVNILGAPGTISWLADGVVIPGQSMDTLTIHPVGTVVYTAVLTDAEGCSVSTDPFTVNVRKCFKIPNAFTPNGDGANDTFGPLFFGSEAEVLQFVIYNRWGQKVFEATPEVNKWDGKQDGVNASSDVYVYKIKVRFANGEEESQNGEVTLLR